MTRVGETLDPAEWIGRTVEVVMDRPLGSTHPRHGFIYPVNYGYVPGVFASDGAELDAYVLGTDEPLAECSGTVIAIVRRHDDIEDKLVVGLTGPLGAEEISAAVAFQEQFFHSEILLG